MDERRALGRLSEALRRMLMRRARVEANELLAGSFRLITLAGEGLRGVDWHAGQKVQIAIGTGLATRTYTPIDWDPLDGRTRLIGYAHGEGPGSDWVRSAAVSDRCDIFGPRSSVDLRRMAPPLALFGDETTFGLAAALVAGASAGPSCHFEVVDVASAELVAGRLGLAAAQFYQRQADGGHLAAMEAALPGLSASGARFVIAGKAGTVQRLRQALKSLSVPTDRITAKAYWAPGKTGLD